MVGDTTILNLDLNVQGCILLILWSLSVLLSSAPSENNSVWALTQSRIDFIQQNSLNKDVLSASYTPGSIQGIGSLVLTQETMWRQKTQTSAFPLKKRLIKLY